MTIRQLPQDVVDKIKSSINVTSLNNVAGGLLANSLDADASKVNISIDYSRGNCTVEDNGSGIPPEEFRDTGGLGKLHHTSKFPPRSSIHGKHGDFLASLATFSLLSVTSRHQRHISHNSISIHNSKVLARHHPSPPEVRLVNFDYGTRVSVRDLFGNMPVRVKQRASLTERPALDKEWSRLVREVVGMLLAWPSAIQVSLTNIATQRELRLRPSDKIDAVSRTSRLLVQASLADSSDADAWVPISASCGSISVKGCICTNPVATRRSQFLSLGIHPVINEFGTDVLFEEINKVFSNSSFGVVDGDEDKGRNSPKLEGFTGRELRIRKAIERWPMFYLKITAPGFDDADGPDRLDGQGQTLSAILDLLKATCYGFLKKHHFRPRKVQLAPDESLFSTSRTLSRSRKPKKQTASSSSSRSGSISPASRLDTRARSDSPFDSWHRVKIGRATPLMASSKTMDVQTKVREKSPAPRLIGEGGRLLRKPFDEPSPEPDDVSTGSSQLITDVAPDKTKSCSVGSITNNDTTAPATQSQPEPNKQRSKWLQQVIDSWENPVFETAEPLIPCIDATNQAGSAQGHSCNSGRSHGVNFDAASMNLSGRVSRQALSEATVISQVDHKYILAKLPLKDIAAEAAPNKPSSALVMLDQHAVDERCRLEDLMAGYFIHDPSTNQVISATETLERPIVFEVPAEEQSLLDQHWDHFAAWGIIYQIPTQSRSSQRNKVVVTALPPSIIERCRREPRLLIELLRTEVWRSVDDGFSRARPSTSDIDKPWISRFHGCPRRILELLHSRACRSAIMFNDVLTVSECEQLVSRLARCAFPFQCAHGRPSMAPLVDLGAGSKFGGWEEKEQQDRVRWKNWIEAS
ncbi:DNA mismatch repair MLH3 [Fusarium albosuccineum]|uniref:DNA mismatch repair MLH3 n=1 Tax=Fusarium albosuccineum TaxID=1237068 RepID=A0A8H4LJC9_9HYPO|nr:DNA mismatch repair MLH3 [Fusarium albosuccineum]